METLLLSIMVDFRLPSLLCIHMLYSNSCKKETFKCINERKPASRGYHHLMRRPEPMIVIIMKKRSHPYSPYQSIIGISWFRSFRFIEMARFGQHGP